MTIAPMHASNPIETDDREEHARAVRGMFSAIAPRYDLLNHLLSLNIDRSWRRRAVDRLGWAARSHGVFLDACAGTYDLAIELARRPGFAGRVIAADFSGPMLRQGLTKIARDAVSPICADTLRLPVRDGALDGAMAGFGVRNLADIDEGLRELRRVLRPGGRVVILDFSVPGGQPLRGLYLFYFRRVLPFIGRIVSKHSFAYNYLPESVLSFSEPGQLGRRLGSVGFVDVGWQELTGGIACVWWGRRPA